MTGHNRIGEIEMHRQLERLVAGELDEARRAEVLAWLDADSARWRICGLAFLEAQTWSHVLSDWNAATTTKRAPHAQAPATQRGSEQHRSRRHAAALAACALAAFALGVLARGAWSGSGSPATSPRIAETGEPQGVQSSEGTGSDPTEGPVLASVSLPPGGDGLPAVDVRIPVVKGDAHAASGPPAGGPETDYVRRQWERRGYQFDAQRRYLLARLPDGKQVAVPVEQLLVSYVGNKVY